MEDLLKPLSSSERWNLLVSAAIRGIGEAGYELERVPGRGLSNVWTLKKGGKEYVTSIRTTRDRYIAFPPLEGGKKWKTLEDVDLVVVATVDSKEAPQNVDVYIFPADEVRKRFDAAYAARRKAGLVVRDNFGMWLALYNDTRNTVANVGSGIAEKQKRIARYSIHELRTAARMEPSNSVEEPLEAPTLERPRSIADVMAWAREQIAELAGVRTEAVKLDLKVEY